MRDGNDLLCNVVDRFLTHHHPELPGEGPGHTHTHLNKQFELPP